MRRLVINLQFEYYVLNHDFNRDKIELFNIFNNYYVQDQTEKEIKKYIRSPKNYKYDSFFKDDESVYGFEGLCKRFEQILRCDEFEASGHRLSNYDYKELLEYLGYDVDIEEISDEEMEEIS